MEWSGTEVVIRIARLRDELQQVPIYPMPDLEPIRPTWLAISHGHIWSRQRPDGIDGYILYFLLDDGTVLAQEQWGTLDIASDQAKAVTGITRDDWRTAKFELREDTVRFSWEEVAATSDGPGAV